jgi:hypothetical protein
MLVLSRRVNEAVVLADRVIVTLVRLLPESVELSIQHVTGGLSTLVELGLEEFVDIGLGARLTLATCGQPPAAPARSAEGRGRGWASRPRRPSQCPGRRCGT